MHKPLRMFLFLLLLSLPALPLFGQRGDDTNRRSKNGRTEAQLQGVEVVLEYGRPQVRGREIWGALVPYGKVWRTGADEATTVSFSADVTVQGQALAAGTYGLFTIPGETEWTIIFNKVADQWGAFGYDAGQDALRVMASPTAHDHVEAMDFAVDGSKIVLRWAELAVPFEVAAAE